MKYYNIVKPVGLDAICDIVAANCAKSGIKPHHMIFHLNSGQGRSTILEYIADMYKINNILNFSTGLDNYLEINFDGTYDNFKRGVEIIHDAAVYSGDGYKALIGINGSALLASHRQETQWIKFNSFIKEISKSANLIFFVDCESTKYTDIVINSIKSNVANVDEVFASPYTDDEYAYIIERNIENNGVKIKDLDKFHSVVANIVKAKNIGTVPDAISLADDIIQYADFSAHVPNIIADNIESLSHSKIIQGGTKR